jgi:5'-3' exonuclease
MNIAYKYKTDRLIFCWDAGRSYRHAHYPAYKKNREDKKKEFSPADKKMHDGLTFQCLQLNHEILPRMGLRNTFCVLDYEADDLIGYFVDKLKGSKIIVGDDSDLYQLLDRSDIHLLRKNKRVNKKWFKKRFGIHPDQWAEAKAIGGCTIDNVIGINGAADPKSPSSKALKYMRGELDSGKIYDRITSKEGKTIIARNLPIVTVPYLPDLIPRLMVRSHKVTRKKLIREFDRWHFVSLLERENFDKWKRIFDL